jgi:DNA-binding Lrp family transcriptional regulator
MITALVLIEADRDVMLTLGPQLVELDGVDQAWSVTGEWDFACVVRAPQHDQLAGVIAGAIGELSGVTRTQTLVAFEAFGG